MLSPKPSQRSGWLQPTTALGPLGNNSISTPCLGKGGPDDPIPFTTDHDSSFISLLLVHFPWIDSLGPGWGALTSWPCAKELLHVHMSCSKSSHRSINMFLVLFCFFNWSIGDLQCFGEEKWFRYIYTHIHFFFKILFNYRLYVLHSRSLLFICFI